MPGTQFHKKNLLRVVAGMQLLKISLIKAVVGMQCLRKNQRPLLPPVMNGAPYRKVTLQEVLGMTHQSRKLQVLLQTFGELLLKMLGPSMPGELNLQRLNLLKKLTRY